MRVINSVAKFVFITMVICSINISAPAIAKTHQETDDNQKSFLDALKSLNQEPSPIFNDTINEFTTKYNANDFTGIYDDLMHTSAKKLKGQDDFTKALSDIKKVSGTYFDGTKSGIAKGIQFFVTDSNGNTLEESIKLKTHSITWRSSFNNGDYSLKFIFVDDGSGKLYQIELTDSSIVPTVDKKA